MTRHVMLTLGQKLRRLRESAGLTQQELAGAIGLTRQTLRSYEDGRTSIRFAELLVVINMLEVDLNVFEENAVITDDVLQRAEVAGLRWRANQLIQLANRKVAEGAVQTSEQATTLDDSKCATKRTKTRRNGPDKLG